MKTLIALSLALVIAFAAAAYALVSSAPDFKVALYQVVLPNEGGWVKDPADSGGETYKGISRKNFPHWSGWSEIDRVKALLPAQPAFGGRAYYAWVKGLNPRLRANPAVTSAVESFYRGYWVQLHMGECRLSTTAYFWADALTNNGPVANRWLKRAINIVAGRRVVDDSNIAITSYTIRELNKRPQDLVLFWFAAARAAKYLALVEKGGYHQYAEPWAERFVRSIVGAVHDRDRLLQEAAQ